MKVNTTNSFSIRKHWFMDFQKQAKNLWFLIIKSQNYIYYWVSENNNKIQKLRIIIITERFKGGIILIKINAKKVQTFPITLYEHEIAITEYMYKLDVFCISWSFISYFITISWHSVFDKSRFCLIMVRNLEKKSIFLFHNTY